MDAIEGQLFCGRGTVISLKKRPSFRGRGKRGALLYFIQVLVRDELSSSLMSLQWFNSYSSVYNKLEALSNVEFIGIIQTYQGRHQIINPIVNGIGESEEESADAIIKYPTINHIPSRTLAGILERIPKHLWDEIPETLPETVMTKRSLLSAAQTFRLLHGIGPLSENPEEQLEKAKERLIYEEFFAEQMKLLIRRKKHRTINAPIFPVTEIDLRDILSLFPFELTPDQKKSFADIIADFRSARPMMRLLQGDVGCGKTVIALAASLATIRYGHQVAFMCPTESLAIQHFESTRKLLSSTGTKTAILLSSTPAQEKELILFGLKAGIIHLVIGTHSLIQDSVIFSCLGLAIIDEQHKFGVDQRIKLVSKGIGVHALIMTATPIPRSLNMAHYGDLDLSIIKTMPLGRKGTKTRIVLPSKFEAFLSFMSARLAMGDQGFVVTPAIEDNDDQDFLALEKVFKRFTVFFPKYKVAFLHGRMKSADKAQVMSDFSNGNIHLLISTSVVEVGINVLNATMMAIINPERFGLSSLHQLRGRVGRSEKPGFCFLVIDKNLSEEQMNRLKGIESTTDGFAIAELDLKIRGEGNVFGTGQSGKENYRKIADVVRNQKQLLEAREDAKSLMEEACPKNNEIIRQLDKDVRVIVTI